MEGDAVSVTAEATDGVDCVLGRGSATVPGLESGATSDPTTLFIRPLPASGCAIVDAGGGGEEEDAGTDAGSDASKTREPTTPVPTLTPTQARCSDDAPADAGTDASADAPADASID